MTKLDIASPVVQQVKNRPEMQETPETQVWSLGWEYPLEKEWQPTPVFLPGKADGQRNVVGYRPKGRKELDETEGLSTHKRHVFRVYSLMGFDVCIWNATTIKILSYTCHPKQFPEAFSYLAFLQSPPCEAITLSKLYCSPHNKPINRWVAGARNSNSIRKASRQRRQRTGVSKNHPPWVSIQASCFY